MQSSVFPSWLSGRVELAPPVAFPFALRGRAVAAKVKPRRTNVAPFVDCLDHEAAAALAVEWQALAKRALEPNIFAEPTYALAAAQHLPGTHRPRFLFVWSGGPQGERGDLLAVCPIHTPGRFESRRIVRSWAHGPGQLAAPLVDAARAADAIGALLAFVRQEMPRAAALELRGVGHDSKTMALLRDYARERGLACDCSPAGDSRAQSVRVASSDSQIAATFGPRRRELEKTGAVTFRSVTHPSDIRFAAEEFLTLDVAARADKSQALLAHPDLTTFVRVLTRLLAARAECRIDRLAIDDVPVAMSIVITSGDGDYVWRTATAPSHAEFGLDGQLMLARIRTAPSNRPPALIDPRWTTMPTIETERLWAAAVTLVDVTVAVSANHNRAASRAVRWVSRWRALRSAVAA